MIDKIKNNKPLLAILLLIIFGIVGGTIAYYSSSDTFTNEFNTAKYKVEVQETFESPDHWLPGDTTPKEVIATNKGETPVAVRIRLTPSWEDENGNPLPLTDNNDIPAAIINFNDNLNIKWVYHDGWYYYKRALFEDQSTTTLMESVTFNPVFDLSGTKNCVENSQTHVKECITEASGYSGGKYKLKVEIETTQFDRYREVWDTDVNIKSATLVDGMLMEPTDFYNVLGGNYSKRSVKTITFVNHIDIPSTAVNSWDVSAERNGSIKAWLINGSGGYDMYIGQDGGVIANPNSSSLLSNYVQVTEIDATYLDTSAVTNMQGMFVDTGEEVDSLRITGLDTWDTSHVTNMKNMFNYTQSTDSQEYMYTREAFIIEGMDNWDVSSVTDMSWMFYKAGQYSTTWNIGDISNWNTSNVTNMSSMFSAAGTRATTWTAGNLKNWKTGNVTNMHWMFYEAGFNAQSFNLDLSNWDTSKVTNMENMFTSAGRNATTWSVGNLSNWDTRNVTNMYGMFSYSGANATTWNSIGTLKVYANDIGAIFCGVSRVKAILNIYSNPTSYSQALSYAATSSDSSIVVNYSSNTSNIDRIVATKTTANVTKGVQLD